MSKIVNRLGVPSIDLAIVDAEPGTLEVTLQVPKSSESKDDIPFLEVTRSEQAVLFNGARQDIVLKLSRSGLQVGEVKYDIDIEQKNHCSTVRHASIPAFREVSFAVTCSSEFQGGPSASLKHNPEVVGAISTAAINFDARRLDMYESRARQWFRDGGVTLNSNGEIYCVTKDAAKAFIDERHCLDGSKRMNASDSSVLADGLSAPAVPDNQYDRQLLQALQGLEGTNTPNKFDLAALAVNTISQAPGFKPDHHITVMQGKNGLIVTQGEGPTSLALQVPQLKQGDVERVAGQMAQSPPAQPVAVQPDQPEQRIKAPTV
jgi:hypothetical protein